MSLHQPTLPGLPAELCQTIYDLAISRRSLSCHLSVKTTIDAPTYAALLAYGPTINQDLRNLDSGHPGDILALVKLASKDVVRSISTAVHELSHKSVSAIDPDDSVPLLQLPGLQNMIIPIQTELTIDSPVRNVQQCIISTPNWPKYEQVALVDYTLLKRCEDGLQDADPGSPRAGALAYNRMQSEACGHRTSFGKAE